MTVLISGATGFVGLNLVEALLARGETVVSFALDAPPEPARARFAALPGQLVVEQGDVGETDAFTACLRRHRVDRLFPFAAITSGPDREREAPERVLQVNLLGFIGQLRAAREAGVRRVIAPSSAAVYGESAYGPGPLHEADTPPVPITVYGVSKYAVERSALRLGAVWGLDGGGARIGALFGPWERDTGLRDLLSPFWQVTRLARAGTDIVLPATLPPYAWAYSRDVTAGLLHLLDMPSFPHRVFNVCSGENWAGLLPEWCRLLQGAYPGWRWRQADEAVGEAAVNIRLADTRPRAALDIGRLRATGWSPAVPAPAALADYLGWHLETPAL